MARLEGKVALVTGAGSGIGAATARRFAQEGALVAVNDMNEAGGTAVTGEIRAAGGTAEFYAGSVTDGDRMRQVVREIVARFGKLDILINNAGVIRDAMAHKMTEQQWDTVLDIHLKGSWLCAVAAFEHMRERGEGGRIINTSSTSSLGNIGQANYSSAKAGMWGLTKTLALEFARYNITVNAVAPGYIVTPMTAQIPEHIKSQVVSHIPLKREGLPEDIANLHLFLASDDAAYITGQIIFVDGGVSVG